MQNDAIRSSFSPGTVKTSVPLPGSAQRAGSFADLLADKVQQAGRPQIKPTTQPGDGTEQSKTPAQIKREAMQQQMLEEDQQLKPLIKKFVATSFIAPIMKMARDNPFKTEMFHGGQAEEMFGQQLDTHMADLISDSSNFSLVDQIYSGLTRMPKAQNTDH